MTLRAIQNRRKSQRRDHKEGEAPSLRVFLQESQANPVHTWERLKPKQPRCEPTTEDETDIE
jgi:hypothetical protein